MGVIVAAILIAVYERVVESWRDQPRLTSTTHTPRPKPPYGTGPWRSRGLGWKRAGG